MTMTGFEKGIYVGQEYDYVLRTCAANTWWVDIWAYEEVGNWNFDTEAEAVAFIEGYEWGTGADKPPVFEPIEEDE